MALVRICPNCSTKNAANEFFCKKPGCGTSLILVQPISVPEDESSAGTPPAADCTPEANRKTSGRPCPNPECRYSDNPADEETCLRCGTLLNPAPVATDTPLTGTRREQVWGLRFPFGEVMISGSLKIGREPSFSPVADRIGDLDCVSRRHAELTVSSGRLTVVDNASTNKVFVNGLPIPADTPVALAPGDEVKFSSQLQATVFSGGT